MTLHLDFDIARDNFMLTVNLDVANGDVLALTGPNGSGKTTTLHAIAGLLPCSRGVISFNDVIFDANASTTSVFLQPEQRKVGVVFQDGALFPHLNALQNVAYGLRAQAVTKSDAVYRAHKMLATLKIDHVANSRPHQLSGGQKLKLCWCLCQR